MKALRPVHGDCCFAPELVRSQSSSCSGGLHARQDGRWDWRLGLIAAGSGRRHGSPETFSKFLILSSSSHTRSSRALDGLGWPAGRGSRRCSQRKSALDNQSLPKSLSAATLRPRGLLACTSRPPRRAFRKALACSLGEDRHTKAGFAVAWHGVAWHMAWAALSLSISISIPIPTRLFVLLPPFFSFFPSLFAMVIRVSPLRPPPPLSTCSLTPLGRPLRSRHPPSLRYTYCPDWQAGRGGVSPTATRLHACTPTPLLPSLGGYSPH